MALVKTDNTILEIRGRFGGVYFKKDPAGQHVQAMPRIVRYTRSPAQLGEWGEGSPFGSTGIKGFSGASSLWHLALLAAFGAAWAAFALAYYFTTHTGEKKHITGWNWYIYYALAFPECEHPPFWKPPHAPGDLPNYIVTYHGMWMYEHGPDEWPTDCPGGYYWEGIPWNEKPSYKTDDFNWHIWWKDPMWVLSPGPGFEPEGKTSYRMAIENHGKITGYYRNPITKKISSVYLGKPPE